METPCKLSALYNEIKSSVPSIALNLCSFAMSKSQMNCWANSSVLSNPFAKVKRLIHEAVVSSFFGAMITGKYILQIFLVSSIFAFSFIIPQTDFQLYLYIPYKSTLFHQKYCGYTMDIV